MTLCMMLCMTLYMTLCMTLCMILWYDTLVSCSVRLKFDFISDQNISTPNSGFTAQTHTNTHTQTHTHTHTHTHTRKHTHTRMHAGAESGEWGGVSAMQLEACT